MLITSIELCNMLKGKLGDKETESLISFTETRSEELFIQRINTLATKSELAETKAELIKWMFIFWAGQIVVITGIMIAIMNAYLK
jgi:hypothetical protein